MTERILQQPGQSFIRPLVLFVAAGALLYLAAVLHAGWGPVGETILRIELLPLALLAVVSSTSYLWRFARWHYMLRGLEYRVPAFRNFLIYLSGLALTTSPGKLGETFRSVLLMPNGVRISHSLAAFFADRLADVVGVCVLGVVAGALSSRSWPYLLTGAFCGVCACSLFLRFLVLHPGSERHWLWLAERLRWLPVQVGQETLRTWAALWSVPRVTRFAFAAVLAYGTQALAFVLLCVAAGIALPLPDGVLIFVNATLFGAASMLPGGLGAMEVSLVLQLMQTGTTEPVAVSVAIATRLVTLWMGVGLGVAALLALSRESCPIRTPLPH